MCVCVCVCVDVCGCVFVSVSVSLCVCLCISHTPRVPSDDHRIRLPLMSNYIISRHAYPPRKTLELLCYHRISAFTHTFTYLGAPIRRGLTNKTDPLDYIYTFVYI